MSGETGMAENIAPHLREIFEQFAITGQLTEMTPYGRGLINDTLFSRIRTDEGEARFIHQRINNHVFKQPEKVMENIERVTRHARQKILAAGGDPLRETLTLIPARDGKTYWHSPDGSYWRTYLFISGARTYDVAENLDQVYHAARAFGDYQRMLADLPGERLHETIPFFHHTRRRFQAFLEALEADTANRAAAAKPEIDFILRREADASRVIDLMERGELPERVTHNDTKLNNVLIDDHSGRGICVIDLDTTMPGSALYDFGDLVRGGVATALEDELELSRMDADLRLFDRIAGGYLDSARDFLTPLEIDLLAFAGRLITLEQAIRFLDDYLRGDVYYKIQRPQHNLDRTRTQVRLVEAMEQKQSEMEAIVSRYRG
jgi:Ser/Thr protein kinase RdoA (MazF antagonist)